jgi:hypothetical protein
MIYISFDIGVKNLAVCILEHKDTIQVIDWRIITLADTKKEIKGVNDISERIFMELDSMMGDLRSKNISEIDHVLIENQPSNLNGIMKTIQHIIFCYFSLIKHWDKIVNNVVLVNASLKTKNHEYQPEIPQQPTVAETKNAKGFRREKYKQNKAMSIAICKYYIKGDQTLSEIFDNNKKKDDLCDACLQAVSYIRSQTKSKEQLAQLNSLTSKMI